MPKKQTKRPGNAASGKKKNKPTPTRKGNGARAAKSAPKTPPSNPNDARGIMLGLACVLTFILKFAGEGNGLLKWLHALAEGLMGNMSIVLPILLGWLCVRAFRASRRGEKGARWVFMPICASVSLLTIVQAFEVDALKKNLGINGYVNFIDKAYEARRGGGAVGSLMGYPLTNVITEWGVLIVFTALIVFMLHRDGIISVFNIASFLSDKSRKAGEKLGDAAGSMGRAVSDRVKTISEERKRKHDELFNEEIYRGEETSPVAPYDLSKGGKKPRVTGVRAVGDEFVVPRTDKNRAVKKKSKEKPAEKTDIFELSPKGSKAGDKAASRREYDDAYDILADLRSEDPKKRNERFVKNALQDHSASPKPVLTFDYASDKTKTGSARVPSQPKRDVSVPAESSAALPREEKKPQQPKPSFFDEPSAPRTDGKSIKQNTEQGKPSDTTYVRPPIAEKPREERLPVAPARNTAATPRPEPDREKPVRPAAAPANEKEPKHERIYYYPPMDLMEAGSGSTSSGSYDDIDRQRAEVLVKTLQNFSIPVKLTGISHGPAVTRFEILPAPGIKVSKVSSYADDIAMALAAVSVRIEAPIPGKTAVGVEVPNVSKEVVHLRDILESNEARRNNKRLMVGLGKDNSGKFIVADLASMPHVLIAGQTGSGKSVCINAIIISILYRATPDEVKMILVDPKMVELNVYNTIPHLLVPVVTDPKKAAGALEWAVGEMQRRYKLFSEHGAKNIESYNSHLQEGAAKMPQIVIIIDELADLMMTSPRDVEDAINRLAQLARAAGMHLVIATQRPSVDVITGLIKANIPTRIAFTVSSGVDSRTILDTIGA